MPQFTVTRVSGKPSNKMLESHQFADQKHQHENHGHPCDQL